MLSEQPHHVTESAPSAQRSWYANIDGLRFFAVISVLLLHTLEIETEYNWLDRAINRFRSPLWLGVDLFFVISGFLITGILLDSRRQGYFSRFYARRTLRIFPIYYLMLFVIFLVAVPLAKMLGVGGETVDTLWSNQLWAWTYLQNVLQARGPEQLPGLGHLWSLAIEEQFYLVWPLFILAIRKSNPLAWVVGLLVAMPLLRWWLLTGDILDTWAIRRLTFTQLDGFLCGAIAALGFRHVALGQLLDRAAKPIMAVATAAFVGLFINYGVYDGYYFGVSTWGYLATALGFMALLWKVTRPHLFGEGTSRLLQHPALVWVGKKSYAIYLFHWPVVKVLQERPDQFLLGHRLKLGALDAFINTGITLGISCVLAAASWRLVEQPFNGLKERWT